MKKMKTSLVTLLLSCMALCGCGETPASSAAPATSSETPAASSEVQSVASSEAEASSETEASSQIPAEADYSFTLSASYGKKLDFDLIDITINDADGNAVTTGTVDDSNTFSFHASTATTYTVALTNIPDGYTLVDTPVLSYETSHLDITLRYLAPSDTTYANGDVMYDYSFTECTSKEIYWLSDTLATKDLVVLNFWYDGCSWCEKEFPYLEQVYQEYKSVAEVFALSYDANAHCKKYKANHNLSFPMGKDPDNFLQTAFDISGYPTTVYVTKNGKIRQIDSGATLKLATWEDNFSQYATLPTD